MAGNYANAKHVLPPELLAEVQRFHTGHLWVPPSELAEDKECGLHAGNKKAALG